MKLLDEFKEFALKSDFVGMATAFVMGAAVGTVVKSLVNDVIMPPIGLALGGTDFSKLAIELKQAAGETPAVAIKYGAFINALISFAVIAFAIFLIVRTYNKAKARFEEEEKEAAKPPPEPTRTEVLLEEIRDALRTERA